jgi:glycosyltransferase involved in cell wall biosynthesis
VVTDAPPWEVIVVDNASTDDTAKVALACWPAGHPVPLRVEPEPKPGLTYARQRGFAAARYDLVSFIDDDNWVCPEWVVLVHQIMSEHPEVGALGGQVEAVCEAEPPPWFEQYKGSYAVGQPAPESGDVTDTRGCLWGAGLTIRRGAWIRLLSAGYRPLLSGRKGKALSSGEDSEICLALRLAGWRLWYDERLTMKHYLPAERLRWAYLRRLHRGFGEAGQLLEVYDAPDRPEPRTLAERRWSTWWWPVASAARGLVTRYLPYLLTYRSLHEGEHEILHVERQVGQIVTFMRYRSQLGRTRREVRTAPWRLRQAVERMR